MQYAQLKDCALQPCSIQERSTAETAWISNRHRSAANDRNTREPTEAISDCAKRESRTPVDEYVHHVQRQVHGPSCTRGKPRVGYDTAATRHWAGGASRPGLRSAWRSVSCMPLPSSRTATL